MVDMGILTFFGFVERGYSKGLLAAWDAACNLGKMNRDGEPKRDGSPEKSCLPTAPTPAYAQ